MYSGRFVFSQVMDYISREAFDRWLRSFHPETAFTDDSLRINSSHSSKSTYPIS